MIPWMLSLPITVGTGYILFLYFTRCALSVLISMSKCCKENI